MPLSVSGQWLVDAGMRMMSRSDQIVWNDWASKHGWSSKESDPKVLPSEIAAIAARALHALITSISADLDNHGFVRDDDDEMMLMNDLGSAVIALRSLEGSLDTTG